MRITRAYIELDPNTEIACCKWNELRNKKQTVVQTITEWVTNMFENPERIEIKEIRIIDKRLEELKEGGR